MHMRGPCENGRLANGEEVEAGAGAEVAPSAAGQRSHRSGRNLSGSGNSELLSDVRLFIIVTTFCRDQKQALSTGNMTYQQLH